jgi:4-diphosphocytidyl-2-C-methyl-D-erythritol kinase
VTSSLLRAHSCSKINLALAVLGRRADGYHEIRTVFQTIDLWDELEFRPSPSLEVICEGLPEVRTEDNLVWKAASLLSSAIGSKVGVSIVLRKRIPAGAGLGGGSGNAAVTLLALRKFWGIDLSDVDLRCLAARLGSDVPFFLSGGTALGVGRGEIIQPLPDAGRQNLVVVFPSVHVSTAAAYGSLNLGLTSAVEDLRIQRFCSQLQDSSCLLTEIFNDFEASILTAFPPIKEAKEFLIGQGATAALLSGSGSSVFGFFPSEESASAAARRSSREAWRVFPAKTLSRAEYLQNMFG